MTGFQRFARLFCKGLFRSASGLHVLLLMCLGVVGLAAQTPTDNKLSRRIKLPEVLKEVSGMTRVPNGDLWLLNDSNNSSDLYRVDPYSGKVLETRRLPVKNYDWEDLTHDPQGRLYIGDFGNNRNQRRNLRIFRYDPAAQILDSIEFSYPDQKAFPPANQQDWNFNCEAFVFFNDSLHLFSKNVFVGNFVTKHYVLPARPGKYVAELRDTLLVANRVITGAALSTDGQTLALTGYIIGKKLGFIPSTKASVMYLTDFPKGRFLRGKMERKRLPKFLIARQYESVTQWTPGRWIVANEGRKPQVQSIWRAKR